MGPLLYSGKTTPLFSCLPLLQLRAPLEPAARGRDGPGGQRPAGGAVLAPHLPPGQPGGHDGEGAGRGHAQGHVLLLLLRRGGPAEVKESLGRRLHFCLLKWHEEHG